MTKYSREKHLEVVLKHLLSRHFRGRELWWAYVDGVDGGPLYDLDKELYMQIVEIMPEVIDKG